MVKNNCLYIVSLHVSNFELYIQKHDLVNVFINKQITMWFNALNNRLIPVCDNFADPGY